MPNPIQNRVQLTSDREALNHPDAHKMRWVAEISKNETQSLVFMPSLLQKKFGISFRKNQGRCLLAQVAFAVAAQLPFIKPSRIVTHVDKWCDHFLNRTIDSDGHTLQEILASFNVPVNIGDGRGLHIDLRLKRHTLLDGAINDVLLGQPVMVIFDRHVCSALEDEANRYKDGEVHSTVIRHGRSNLYHCMMIVGLDVSGYLILRDIRDVYGFRGYLKVATHILADGFKHLEMFSPEIHGFTLTPSYQFPAEKVEKRPSKQKTEFTISLAELNM